MESNNPLVIVVDPGHGGHDVGAQGQGRLEKDDNLRLGLAVRNVLDCQGVQTIMTRDADVFISLADRVNIANANDADLLVSLHRNSSEQGAGYGVENYIYLTAPEVTSGQAAQLVLDNVVRVGVQSDRGVRRGNYYILRRSKMPAMLLEMGFINNEEDNRLFDQNLNAYAEAIARGVLEYFGVSWQHPAEPTPPVQPVPPIWTLPTDPPVQPVPPIWTLPDPPVQPVPPIGTLPDPPVQPVPPIGTLPDPPVQPVPPIGTLPPIRPVPPIGTLPPESCRKDLIVDAQNALNALFGMRLQVDGEFGPATKQAAIQALQAQINETRGLNIPVDGVFGPQTKAALPALRQGDQGNLVAVLQILLKLHGYDPGRIDGVFCPRTKTAVTLFQRDNFLVPDGVAGPRTLAYLLQ